MNDDDPRDLNRDLERLGAATAEVRPSHGFEARVMAAITTTPSPPTWEHGVLRFGRAMLVVAGLSAVTATIVGWQSVSAETEASATAYGMEELEW